MMIQAVLFDANYWHNKNSREWLRKNYYIPIKRVHKTEKYYRYRVAEPKKDAEYKFISLPNHIKLITMS